MKTNINMLKNNSVAEVITSVKKEEANLKAIKNTLVELASKDEAYNTIKVLSELDYRTIRVSSNSDIAKVKGYLNDNLNELIEKLKSNNLKIISDLIKSLCTEEAIKYSMFGTISELFGDIAGNDIQVITANKSFAAFLPHIFMVKHKTISPEIDENKVETQDIMVICRDIIKELNLKVNLPISTNVAETVVLNKKLLNTKNLVKDLVEMAIDNHPVINWIDSIYSLYLLQEEAIKTAECWQRNMAEIDGKTAISNPKPVKEVKEACKAGYERIEETTVVKKYVSNTTSSSSGGSSSSSGSSSEYSTSEIILGGIVVAGAAYGAYRAGKWAYNKITGKTGDYGVSMSATSGFASLGL